MPRRVLREAGFATSTLHAKTLQALELKAGDKKHHGEKHYVMFIDATRCYGCMACVVACAAENNVPLGFFRTWIEKYVMEGGVIVWVPKQCNHCDNPPCVKPCPTGATYKREDGIVLVDSKKCIGCGACVQACPYGARFLNPVKGVADKCTFCEHRLKEGMLPACVETCPTGARVFGDLNEVGGELRTLIMTTVTQRLKTYVGTDPQIYYKGLPKEADV